MPAYLSCFAEKVVNECVAWPRANHKIWPVLTSVQCSVYLCLSVGHNLEP